MTQNAFRWALSILFVLGGTTTFAERATEPTRPSEAEAQLRFLASDELAGRLTGTPGNRAAARFIAETLRRYGVSKPEGWSDYLQPVPLVRGGAPKSQRLAINGRPLRPGEDFAVVSGGSAEFRGAAAAAGFGLANDEGDDYGGVDAAGRAILARFGLRGQRPSPRSFGIKSKAAAQRGARLLLEFYGGPGWERVADYLGRSRIRLEGGKDGGAGIPHLLIRESEDLSYEQLAALDTVEVELSLGPRAEEAISSANVVGVVAGTDPALAGECVVAMAHYDHVGSGMDVPGATRADSIFNGARDNGIGVVALLAAAERIAARPAARTVVFLATTAEEQGLLGSAHYIDVPVCQLDKTVFALNVDGAGIGDTGVATVLGLNRNGAKAAIEAAAAEAGLEAIPEPEEAAAFFERSDNANFARAGIPTVTFSPGFRKLDAEVMRHYHQPSDEAGDDFDFAYVTRFAQAFANAAANIANLPTAPAWSAGDPYEPAAEKLYRPR